MTDTRCMRPSWSAVSVIGTVMVLVGAAWWLWLSVFSGSTINSVRAERVIEVTSPTAVATASPTAVAVSAPASLLIDTDLETGSREFSAVARNARTNRLLVADDSGRLYEFDLDTTGAPILPARRTVVVQVGAGDIEGVAWLSGSTYVLAHENDGRLTIVEIADDATTIGPEQLLRTIDTGIREDDGNGLEGVAVVRGHPNIEFVVVDERPAALHLIGYDGQPIGSSLELDLPDASDIWVDDDALYVVSDEARVVVALTLSEPGTVPAELSRITLDFDDGRFEQVEGVVGDGQGGLFVVGENPGPAQYVFGLLPAIPLDG